jgi:hypothetical protein
MRKFLWIATGTLIGLVCAFGGLGLAGAGHGWTSAWPFGLSSLILTPWAFYRLGKFREISQPTSFVLLALALALDALLFGMTLFGNVKYFYRIINPALIWLSVWSVWQIVVVATILMSRYRSNGDATRQSADIKKVVRQRLDVKRKGDRAV